MADGVRASGNGIDVLDVLSDCQNLAQLDGSKFEEVCVALRTLQGIPEDAALERVILNIIGEPEAAASVIMWLINVAPDSASQIIDQIAELRQSTRVGTMIPVDQFETFKQRLPRLISDQPAVARYKKAIHLANLTGNAAESVDIICDIRPVFSDSRDEIVGLIPATVMRLAYESQDGAEHVVEVTLSGEFLDQLAEKVNFAQKKLRVIEATGNQWIPGGIVK